ncbi:helix-turn-helix transcriptional regulator [Salmonella enterica]|nr:helix-turn-helix transcriptional regulator [Salmonella enterica]EBR8060654.1 XRE family transcriptional regulator [Salmonella enterica subsp. enterica serovar Soerenga]ECS8612951.1 XRE family transcriptional regulator [Salmonella enterica subsp. enterica serovar Soerenga]ECY6422500.1 helix-turn-helix transcriptional regulator [Salmonella enterica subsp. enterica serovar Soerenga]EDV6921409.1 helix-turn-helix transcriptional regulator [Salmonella enterica subsp. enterica serovar Soerenga]
MTINDSIATRIIERRAELEMSQNDLACEAGVAPAQISRYESGKTLPRPKVIARLAEALLVPYSWLAYGEGREVGIPGSGRIDLHFNVPKEVRDFFEQKSTEEGVSKEDLFVEMYELFKKNNS